MADETKVIINNVINDEVLIQIAGNIQNTLNTIAAQVESLGQFMRVMAERAPTAAIQPFEAPVPTRYTACRSWIHGLANHLCVRWVCQPHTVWRIFYNDLSDFLGANILESWKDFQFTYGKASCLDMVDVLGYLHAFAEHLRELYADGQSMPQYRYESDTKEKVPFVPIGECAGQSIVSLLAKRKNKLVGRTRKARQETQVVQDVAAKVDEFKAQQEQTLRDAAAQAIVDEYSPQTIADRANLAEAQLSALSDAQQPEMLAEPWQSIQNSN